MSNNNTSIHSKDNTSSRKKKNSMEQKLSLQEFNKILSDINSLQYGGSMTPMLSHIESTSDSKIYKINKPNFENIFLKITTVCDSYGSSYVNKIQFTIAKERTVFDYVTI